MSPEVQFFADIRKEWDSLDTSSDVVIMKLELDESTKCEVVEFYTDYLQKTNMKGEMAARDDYKELAECSLMIIGEVPPSGKISWKKAGACHKARFMAFAIYSMKALAFCDQLDLDEETVDSLRRLCKFLVSIYNVHFLSSSDGRDSAVNDLDLYKRLFQYRSIDSQIAEEALVVLRRHGWYSVPEVVVFTLFSNKISADEKSRLACKLISYEDDQPDQYRLGKPIFPVIEENTEIVDLITPESFKFFKIIKSDYSWLSKNPADWKSDDHYKAAERFVSSVKVTNDVAERGVKLATDYAHILTKDDEMRQVILQGVERSRKMFPDFRKKTLNKGS